MKISKVAARLLQAEPRTVIVSAAGRNPKLASVLVEVETDEGISGYGEAMARGGGAATKEAVLQLLAPIIVGQNPLNIEGLFRAMLKEPRRWGHDGGMVIEALSGIDIALWDIAGKAYGRPVRDLLMGAGRDTVDVYGSSVYIDTVENMVAATKEQVAAGYSMVKLKVGRPASHGGWRADLRAITAIREAVDDDIDLAVDANSAYDAADAVRMARQFEQLGISFFEEPVPPDDLDGYARVRASSSVPLAGGETYFLPYKFNEVLRRGLLDVVQPELARCGGITGARQVAALAQASRVRFAPHTGLSGGLSHLAALHVAAAAAELYTFEYMFIAHPLREIFLGGYPRPTNGVLAVPTGPGLGLELDWDAIDSYTSA